MGDNDVRKTLMDIARNEGICGEGYKRMSESGIDGLLSYYVQNPDWCMERSYPSIEEIRSLFSKETLERHGVYVDKVFNGDLLDRKQAYIFHNCSGHINVALNYDDEIIPMLYFANGCDMVIGCRQENIFPIRVPIYIFGENTVKTEDTPNANFIIYRHNLLA